MGPEPEARRSTGMQVPRSRPAAWRDLQRGSPGRIHGPEASTAFHELRSTPEPPQWPKLVVCPDRPSARFCYRVREGFCPLRNSSRALSRPPGVDEADLGMGSEGHPEVIFQAPKASSRSASPADRDPATELMRRFFWRSLAYGDVCQLRYPHSHKCSWFVLAINGHKPDGGKGQIWLPLVNNGH